TATNSVAIGYGATTTQANEFSVGHGGSGALGPATRRVTNVSDGIADSDAATVGQLDAVAGIAEQTARYFQADGENDGSDDASISGTGASAAGANASAAGTESSAFGAGALAGNDFATAVGGQALATGFNSTALGSWSSASGSNSLAVGADADAS